MTRTIADALADLADLMRTRRAEAEAREDRALSSAYRNREDAYRHAASIAESWEPEPEPGWPPLADRAADAPWAPGELTEVYGS